MKLKKTTILSAALLAFSATGSADALTNQQVKELVAAANKGNYADLTRLTSNAKDGDANAQTGLGLFYVEKKNYAKAISWFQKAANHGYAPAEDGLALVYYKGLGVPQNYIKAAYWYGKAAQQGDVAAEYTLGLSYAKGQGVHMDTETAIYWWKKVAAQGGAYGTMAQHDINILENSRTR